MHLVVAGAAKGHEVCFVMRPSAVDWQDVVYLFDRGHASVFEAQLTQRVLCNIAVTDAFPCPSIGFVDVRVSLVLVVPLALGFLMGWAILTVSQPRAAGVCTWFLGTAWHLFHLDFGHKKSPRRISPTKAVLYFVPKYNPIRRGY